VETIVLMADHLVLLYLDVEEEVEHVQNERRDCKYSEPLSVVSVAVIFVVVVIGAPS
jgi:hypothetical protein